MHLTFSKKIILITALFAAGSLAIIGFVIVPTVRSIQQLDQETYDLRMSLEQRYQNDLTVHSMLAEISKDKTAVAPYSVHLFHAGQELNLITFLEGTAQKDSITQKVVSSNLDANHSQQITMSLALTGQYQNTLRYLDDLEHGPFFITITHLYLSPTQNFGPPLSGQNQTYTLNLDFHLYVTP